MSIYEVHLGSWLKGEHHQPLTYRQLAEKLVAYVQRMGYTHIELMPIAEHPYAPSWGYQVIGYFAPTSRYGAPQDFMYFVDRCHQAGIGVIVDWVPAHFPKDAHGLAFFDGTALYEHEDPRLGEHTDWGTLIFNYGRNEVRSFLMSNAMFWLKKYHIDGLRVDAVASMLYLDYSRKPGDWVPNIYGGNENLEAIDFLRKTNELAHQVPGAMTIAEESTAFTGRFAARVSERTGLHHEVEHGLDARHAPLFRTRSRSIRKYHQNDITFSMVYAFTENFVLPDLARRGRLREAGAARQNAGRRMAAICERSGLFELYVRPSGKEVAFHGLRDRPNQRMELTRAQVEWWLLDHEIHRRFQAFCAALNGLYQSEPALYEIDFQPAGFEWIDFHDSRQFHRFVRAARKTQRRLSGFRLQLHSDAARQLPNRYARSGIAPRDLQLRRRDLRRKQHGKRRVRECRRYSIAWKSGFGQHCRSSARGCRS